MNQSIIQKPSQLVDDSGRMKIGKKNFHLYKNQLVGKAARHKLKNLVTVAQINIEVQKWSTRNMVIDKILFQQCFQKKWENTDQFIKKYDIGNTCQFHDIKDRIMIKLIMKCQDTKSQQYLISIEDPTLDRVLNYLKLIEINKIPNNYVEYRKPYYEKHKSDTIQVSTIINNDNTIMTELSLKNENNLNKLN
ncbi:hypothetical protein A3Q56_05231 [Intoshia linei]|uniref:Uncharacterized protein n=1 Tax=Intoshia linei TaxID=1819745 RepID=A0A177AYG7_9BILA|nr:hypothetical protein A3Q56_05231 [Intoshia linei]